MKKIIASTIAAGLIAGTTITAAADTPLERAAAPTAQGEQMGGEDGDAGPILIVLLGAAAAAGAVILIESGEDEDAPTSP